MNCPHCGKPLALVAGEPTIRDRTALEPTTPRKAGRPRKMLALKVPFPDKGEALDFHRRYFNEGDEITFKPRVGPREGEVITGIVTKVSRNSYGRISYQTKDQVFIMTEEVQEAMK